MGRTATVVEGWYGRLFVIGPEKKHGFTQWRCRCECGVEIVARGGDLRRGTTRSCGCLQRESQSANGRSNTRHGMTHTPEYKSWSAMRDRCLSPSNTSYPHYGGRGITICARWNSFEAFFEDMGQRPPGMTLERKDVNSDYEPNNCEWASKSVQSANQRRFIDPQAKADWKAKVIEGQIRGRANHSAAQKRRWQKWREERGKV